MQRVGEFELLRSGVDALEVAFQGALSVSALSMLDEARAEGKKKEQDQVCDFGVFDCLVRHFGSSATKGYSYVFSTGLMGETWMIKANEDPEQWNIRVDVKAAQLATDGYAKVKENLWGRLEAMGAMVLSESIGRIDICVDLICPNFQLKPHLFVHHSRVKTERNFEPIEEMNLSLMGSRRLTGFTLGKMPGRQIQIYDKRLEVKTKPSSQHWYKIWKVEPENCPHIWRVELRFGKTFLNGWSVDKNNSNAEPLPVKVDKKTGKKMVVLTKQEKLSGKTIVKTFRHLEGALPIMIKDFLQSIRYVKTRQINNISRGENHDLWVIVGKALSGDLNGIGKAVEGVEAVRGRIVEGYREQLGQMYWSQIKGLLPGFMVTHGITHDRALEDGAEILWDAMTELGGEDRKKLLDGLEKAYKKIHLLDPLKELETLKDDKRTNFAGS
jgi:hypothetical protein